jgi:hypothetical protein
VNFLAINDAINALPENGLESELPRAARAFSVEISQRNQQLYGESQDEHK